MQFRVFRYLALLLALLLPGAPVHAQSWDSPNLALMDDYSEAEKIGFAFYQMIRRDPPFEDWISANPVFQQASIPRQYYMRHSERARLKKGFITYLPDRDTIKIHTKIRLRALPSDRPGSYRIGINFRSTDAEIYFPFQLGPLWIAVMPRGLTQEMIYTVSEADLIRMRVHFGQMALAGAEDVQGELVIIPVSADPVTPIEVGDQPLWPLHAELKTLRLLNAKSQPVWSVDVDGNGPDLMR